MAKQQVILVDRNNRKLGAEEKLSAHQKNLKHRSFSILIFNQKNQLLLQQRNRNKYHAGGLWSNTCCSHPAPGEETAQAAKRRLKKEMGISCSLKEIFSFNYQTKLGGIFENEFDHVFVGRYNGNPKPDPEEVEAWQWIDLKKLKTDIKRNPGKYTYWFKSIIEKYWDKIEKTLEKEAHPFYKFAVRYNPMLGKKLKEVHFFVPSGGCQKARKTGPCTMCVFYEPWKLLDAPARKPTIKEITNLYHQHVFSLILSTSAELLRLDGGGSFINENEFPVSALCTIFKNFLPKTIRIVEIESRPEFVTDKVLRQLKNVLPKGVNLLVHMGIETGSEVYRNQLLNKNTTDKEITTAVKKLQKYGFKSGAYLLAGLPKLTREQSITDAIASIRFCSQIGFDSIVLCPTVVPDLNSKLGDLYKKKQFFPLRYRDIINIVDATKDCPVVLAFGDDPPAAVGTSGSLADKEKLDYFRENHILNFEGIKNEKN
jgi:isopentenyl-diphosphate delta-isomerase